MTNNTYSRWQIIAVMLFHCLPVFSSDNPDICPRYEFVLKKACSHPYNALKKIVPNLPDDVYAKIMSFFEKRVAIPSTLQSRTPMSSLFVAWQKKHGQNIIALCKMNDGIPGWDTGFIFYELRKDNFDYTGRNLGANVKVTHKKNARFIMKKSSHETTRCRQLFGPSIVPEEAIAMRYVDAAKKQRMAVMEPTFDRDPSSIWYNLTTPTRNTLKHYLLVLPSTYPVDKNQYVI